MPALNRKVSHRPSPVTIVVAAVLALALLAALCWIALVAPRGVPFLKYFDINAQFNNASEIADLSQVRIAGRSVGQVTGSSVRTATPSSRWRSTPGRPALRAGLDGADPAEGPARRQVRRDHPGTHGRC